MISQLQQVLVEQLTAFTVLALFKLHVPFICADRTWVIQIGEPLRGCREHVYKSLHAN